MIDVEIRLKELDQVVAHVQIPENKATYIDNIGGQFFAKLNQGSYY